MGNVGDLVNFNLYIYRKMAELGETCSICLSYFSYQEPARGESFCERLRRWLKREKKAVMLSCGHRFHKNCVKEWIRGIPNKTKTKIRGKCCPNCRESDVVIIAEYSITFDEDEDVKPLRHNTRSSFQNDNI